ncbi:MAG: S8 family serine peptidase [Propionicimonas sp.]
MIALTAALLAALPVAGASAATAGTVSVVGSGPTDAVLPLPADDVTSTDDDLGSVAREVVTVDVSKNRTKVRKLRARTQADAKKLVEHLDKKPGVSAELNHVVRVSVTPAEHTASVQPRMGAEPGTEQWGLTAVHAESAWPITRGSGVKVAVIDTGVDATHPDLADRALPAIDLVGDGNSGDPNGHGTHVAGIIAASLDGVGVAGVANQVSVLPVRVMDASGSGDLATVASGIIAAVDAGAQVINLSLGTSYDSVVLAEAVQYATDRGATVAAAAGNSSSDGVPLYPAALSGVIGVASVDKDLARSPFSNSGSFIDLAAPGGSILSTIPGGSWGFMSGTSMATGFVSATAALVRAANTALSRGQVESILLATAADDASGDGRDQVYGYGLVRADRAALNAKSAPVAPGAPTGVSATAGNASAVVRWTAPSSNGGSAVTGYTATASPGGRSCSTTGSVSCTVTGLTNGASYTFTAVARNAVGTSPRSVASKAIIPRTVPGAPSAVRVTKVYTSTLTISAISLAWTPPASNGGSAVTGYTVKVSPGGQTKATAANALTWSGLAPGVSYRFTVAARNVAGSSPSSAPSAAVTPPPPSAAVAVKALDSGGSLYVDVNPDKGSGYWTFKVQKRGSTGSWTTLSTTYKTYGASESRTLNLAKGTYRVVVAAKYGYLSKTSAAVVLSR